jgi:hypothetical protein
MPVLMLGGARDEVVPRLQMQELWAIIRTHGRGDRDDAAAAAAGSSKKSPLAGGGGGASGSAEDKDEDEDVDEKKEEDGPGAGPANNDPKAPPRVLVDGVNKYIEFGAGMHSE